MPLVSQSKKSRISGWTLLLIKRRLAVPFYLHKSLLSSNKSVENKYRKTGKNSFSSYFKWELLFKIIENYSLIVWGSILFWKEWSYRIHSWAPHLSRYCDNLKVAHQLTALRSISLCYLEVLCTFQEVPN